MSSSLDLKVLLQKIVSRKVKLVCSQGQSSVDASILKIDLNTFSQSEGARHSLVYS